MAYERESPRRTRKPTQVRLVETKFIWGNLNRLFAWPSKLVVGHGLAVKIRYSFSQAGRSWQLECGWKLLDTGFRMDGQCRSQCQTQNPTGANCLGRSSNTERPRHAVLHKSTVWGVSILSTSHGVLHTPITEIETVQQARESHQCTTAITMTGQAGQFCMHVMLCHGAPTLGGIAPRVLSVVQRLAPLNE